MRNNKCFFHTDSRAHTRKETRKILHVFILNESVLHRSVELNIPEDNQCLGFILLTVTEMSKYYRENPPVGCHSWKNRFCMTHELPKQVLCTNILCMLFLSYCL